MSRVANPACERGQTVPSGRLAHLYGFETTFDNIRSLPSTEAGVKQDERLVRMRFVKNDSGGALLPGQTVSWKSGYAGKRVTNPAASATAQIVGTVDPLLPSAGVADGEGFWIVVDGPCKFRLDANATSAEFDALIASASVAGCVRTGTTSGGIVGRNEQSGTADAGGGALATATVIWGTFRPN
jgi:hypothetical protein